MTEPVATDASATRSRDRLGVTTRDLLTPAFYHWQAALMAFLVPLILALGVAMIAKPIYTAQSRLLILPGDDYVFRGSPGSSAPTQTFDRAQIVNAEMEILKSKDLQEEVVRKVGFSRVFPNLRDDRRGMDQALERLGKDLRIENIPSSNVIELQLRHRNPQVSAAVLNTLVALYIQRRQTIFERSDAKLAAGQQAELSRRIAGIESEISALSTEHHLGDYGPELIAVQTQQTTLMTQLQTMDQQISAAGGRAGRLQKDMSDAPRTIVLNADDVRSQQAEALTAALMNVKEQRRLAAAKYRDDYPLVVELDRQIAGLEGALAAAPAQQTGLVRRGANPVYQNLDTQLATTRGEAAGLVAAREKVGQALQTNTTRLTELIDIGPRYRELLRNRALLEGAYQDVARRTEDAQIAGALAGAQANVRVIERAEPPSKGRAGRSIILAAGILLGGAAALAVIVLATATSQVMLSPSDVEAKLDLPILGAIPLGDKDAARAPLWRPLPGRMSADDVNILHRLLRSLVGQGGGVIQWIAADTGEGVTSLALDMAILRARRSRAKVLLVDVEPVEPGGLAGRIQRLGGRVEMVSKADHTFRINDSNLYVTGPMCGPGRSLPEERWASFFATARREYALTVVDSPAFRRSAAGVLVAPLVDLNLVVVEAEVTRAPVVANLIRRVENAGGYVSGVVLNKRRFHIPQFLYKRL